VALIKRADAESRSHTRVTLNFGDLERRGAVLREAAIAEAERVVRDAHAERARILAGAAGEGRAAGHAEGLANGLAEGRAQGRTEGLAECRERLAEIDASWSGMMAEFLGQRESLLVESRRGVVELAIAIAERVVHRAIETDPAAVEGQLREVLSLVAAPATLIVRIHPEDEELVREIVPRLREQFVGGVHVRLQSDSAVSRGSCLARTLGGASIDASVETQLDRIVRDLLPDRGVGGGA
jgi:flagellar biosynthesis/type III secretory pathway protein FliH